MKKHSLILTDYIILIKVKDDLKKIQIVFFNA